jgi:hypothetical protein
MRHETKRRPGILPVIILYSLVLLALCLAPVALSAQSGSRGTAPEYLVLVSVDACRPEYYSLGRLPNFEELLRGGTFYPEAWVGALESNTPPGHTEMATGSFPSRNGIFGFGWRDAATGRTTRPTSLEAISRGEFASIVEKSGVATLSAAVKAKWPDAKVAVATAHKFYAAQGLGVGPSDYIVYAETEKSGGSKLLAPAALPGKSPGAAFLGDPSLRGSTANPGDDMRFVFTLARALLESFRPRALLLNLPETDGLGHKTGGLSDPEAMRSVMAGFDEGLGELIRAYKDAGIYDSTLWVITADHGMTAMSEYVDARAIAKILKSAAAPGKGLPYLYLADPSKARIAAEAIAAASGEGRLEGVTGAYFLQKAGGSWSYERAAGGPVVEPGLDGAYRSLMAGFAGPEAPDVVVTSAEGYGFGDPRVRPLKKKAIGAAKVTRGSHGMVNWADQHISLLFHGPGLRAGLVSASPARLVDILPTIALAMGLSPTGSVDGTALADAIETAPAGARKARENLDAALSPLRDALRDSAK